MALLLRTARTEDDLIEIWTYIAQADIAAADRMLDRIDALCWRLAENPYLGPARPDLAEGLRYFVARPYLVLYRQIKGGAQIVRVVHGARDLPSLFQDV